MSLPREVEEVATLYRALAGETVRGAFVIGSAALGDWWPGASDIDLVALVDTVDPSHDERLREIHARGRGSGHGSRPRCGVSPAPGPGARAGRRRRAAAPPRRPAAPRHRDDDPRDLAQPRRAWGVGPRSGRRPGGAWRGVAGRRDAA